MAYVFDLDDVEQEPTKFDDGFGGAEYRVMVEVTVKVPVSNENDGHPSKLTKQQILCYVDDMERLDLGELVLNDLPKAKVL
jgi:hypothetical protein